MNTDASTKHPGLPTRQNGAALVVGMILLLILTVLGISNMNTTTIELKMAANTQNRNHCFQIAEAGIGRSIESNAGDFFIDFTTLNDQMGIGTFKNAKASVAVDALFRGQVSGASCPGSSMLKFSCIHYEIQSNGATDAGGAACQNVQGVFRVAPKPTS